MRIKEITINETTWNDIYRLNQSQLPGGPNQLRVGQTLEMPDGTFYNVAAGDNLSKIAGGQGKGSYHRETATGTIEPFDPRGAYRGDNRSSTPGPTKTTVKTGPAPDGSIVKAVNIPWETTYPQFKGLDMVKIKGTWMIKGGTASQYAKEPAFVQQLEDLWARQP
jgi:LysM repeat protein